MRLIPYTISKTGQCAGVTWAKAKDADPAANGCVQGLINKFIFAQLACLSYGLAQQGRMGETMAQWIYKLATQQQWQAAMAAGQFDGAPVDLADGYIHFSSAQQVQETARKHFRTVEDLLLLVISVEILEQAAQPLAWEPSRGGALFPHLYCPMPLEAVIAQTQLPLDAEGFHIFPPLPEE